MPLDSKENDVQATGDGRTILRSILSSRDLILVTGKGGAGKTTVVAALSKIAAQARGGAVAVECAAHPRLRNAVASDAAVRLVNVDVERALPAVLHRLLRVPQLLSALLTNRVVRLFIRTSPAISEMILLDEICALAKLHGSQGRPVIVDLPATGHALSLLDTPRAVTRLLRVGPLAKRASEIEQFLLDRQRCELLVVALPEELPINETIELMQRADAAGFSCRAIIVNQVPSVPVGQQDDGLLDIMQQAGDSAFSHTVDAVRSEMASADLARAQIERLRSQVTAPIVEIPVHVGADPLQRSETLARTLC